MNNNKINLFDHMNGTQIAQMEITESIQKLYIIGFAQKTNGSFVCTHLHM